MSQNVTTASRNVNFMSQNVRKVSFMSQNVRKSSRKVSQVSFKKIGRKSKEK